MARSTWALFSALVLASVARAQPSPRVQERISAAIAAAGNESSIDYTEFVNPFIGTGMHVRDAPFLVEDSNDGPATTDFNFYGDVW